MSIEGVPIRVERLIRRQPVLFCALALILPAGLLAGDHEEYAARRIPLELLKDQGAVYRLIETDLEVEDDHRATIHETRVVTIFSKDDRDEGEMVVYYNKLMDLTDLDGALYDAEGNKIRSLGKEDIKDYSAINGYTLYADSRVRVAELYHDQYPYTVEFTYDLRLSGYINWPEWYAQPTSHPVENSRFIVTLPRDMPLREWTNRDSVKCTRTADGMFMVYSWADSMMPGISEEFRRDDWEDLTTVVRIAPGKFSIDGFNGDLSSWTTFGKWYEKLCDGRDVLPESAVQQADSVVRGIENSMEKTAALYRYLQSRTRYVNVSLGIGGWQPFDATYVHEHGYGDCKALSNYMVSLLERAGVVAYPVLISSGSAEPPLRTDFPSNQFNHVVVCVPLPEDTVWLECTSQSIPFGHMGETTENRDALMVAPSGGVIVHVPPSTPAQNFQRQSGIVTLLNSGTANARVITRFGGDQADHVRFALYEEPPIEREKWISSGVGIPNMKLVDYSTEGLETKEDVLTLSLQLSLPRYGSVSGERIFFNPNLMERRTYVPRERSQKFSPVRFAYPYDKVDSIVYRFPRGYVCEAVPSPVVLESSFGSFQSTTKCLGDTAIVYTRALEITKVLVPPEQYSEYRNFFAGVVKADRSQVVLVQK